MNRDNAKEFIPLINALAEGKTIQLMTRNGWVDIVLTFFSKDPSFYRIKPEPRTFYLAERPGQRLPFLFGTAAERTSFISLHSGITNWKTFEVIELLNS